MSRKKARAEPTMGELWVAMAMILAFQKAHEMEPIEYFREAARDWEGLVRKLEAFRRDPANEAAIFAEALTAAKQIGRGETKQ